MLFERNGSDRAFQISIELPCCDRPEVNRFRKILFHRPFGQNPLSERIDQSSEFAFSFFDLPFDIEDFPLLFIVRFDRILQVFLAGLELAMVPSLKKFVSVSERRLDQLGNRPVFNENGIEKQKRFDHHGQTGRIFLVDGKIPVDLGIRRGRKGIFQLHPLRRKTIEKPFDFRILQHSVNDLGQFIRIRQTAFFRSVQKPLVRTTPPKGKGQFGSQRIRIVVRNGLVPKDKQWRGKDCGNHFFHPRREGFLGFHLSLSIADVPVCDLLFNRGTESQTKEGFQSISDFPFQILRVRGGGEELFPDAHGSLIEVRAFHDGNAQLKKGVHQKRRQGQLVGLVVKAVGRSQILWKRSDLAESLVTMIGGGPDDLGYRFSRSLQVLGSASHHLLRKFKEVAFDTE